MNYLKNYNLWLKSDYFNEATKEELREISNDEKEIEERFYKDLDFGTGGIRGIIGAGTNRMNIYTIRKATKGLANYILKNFKNEKHRGVVIAYDSRRKSKEFADQTALVLNANGIKAYVFESLRPTPELSFAIRELGCIAGIVITASHNPPEYNGYKVYFEDGAQVPFPVDIEIIAEVNMVKDYDTIKIMDKKVAVEKGLYNLVGKELDEKYNEKVVNEAINKNIIKNSDLNIIYTPIHGTGNKPVRLALETAGFKNVHVVKEQEMPDENFTTVGYPNPEDKNVFTLAIKMAEEINADIIIGTDPDADRVGAVVKNNKGEYVVLNGNMVGVLLTDYILSQMAEKETLPKEGVVISTIVSTNMTKEIANYYNMEYIETLTGFKYIGEKIKNFEKTNKKFLFGFEESYGYLKGTYARDKDAVVATLLICEMASYYKNKGMSLYEGLTKVYEKYGYYLESIKTITLEGKAGIETMEKIINNIRENLFKDIDGIKVVESRDYKTKVIIDNVTGETKKTDVPVSNVLYFTLEDGSWFCIRPSGTEPKIKIYFGVKDSSKEQSEKHLNSLIESVMEKVNKAK